MKYNSFQISARLVGPLKYDDAELISIIRDEYLIPKATLPYNLRRPAKADISISWAIINSILKSLYPTKQNGFFVEAGAQDGEYFSNSLNLERKQNWTGLLVEPENHNFAELKKRNRKAWISPSCLSIHPYPETMTLQRIDSQPYGTAIHNQGTGSIIKVEEFSLCWNFCSLNF